MKKKGLTFVLGMACEYSLNILSCCFFSDEVEKPLRKRLSSFNI